MNMDTIDVAMLVGLVVVTVAKWLVYTGLLWGMIKLQKLNYNTLGLFGSSLAATLVAFIPYVGSYLSYAVLIFCLWKCTGAEIAPDIIFTVGIAGALMFCVNLFVIGALMGDVRSDLSAEARENDDFTEMAETDGEEEPDESEPPIQEPAVAPATVATQTKPAHVKANSGSLVLKGVTFSGRQPLVMISDGTRVHTVSSGESFTATLPQGRTKFSCEEITKTSVTLKSGQGEQIRLQLQ